MSPRVRIVVAISLLLCVLPLFTMRPVPSVAQASTQAPVWAFEGAFANYTLTETVSNATVNSGWESYRINSVNLTAGVFNMTTEFLDQGLASGGRGPLTQSAIVPINSSLAFPALNTAELEMLNEGKLPAGVQNASVATATLVTVRAGSFQSDKVSALSGQSLIWIDSFSGLVIKSQAVVPQSLGLGNALIEIELSSTNVLAGNTLPLGLAFVAVSTVSAVFLVIGIMIAMGRRKPDSSEKNTLDAETKTHI